VNWVAVWTESGTERVGAVVELRLHQSNRGAVVITDDTHELAYITCGSGSAHDAHFYDTVTWSIERERRLMDRAKADAEARAARAAPAVDEGEP